MADSSQNDVNQHSVRFSSVNQEISPLTQDNSLEMTRTKTSADEPPERLTDEQRKDIRELSMSLQKSRMQSARLNQFVMEPVSLPTSRVSLIQLISCFNSDHLGTFRFFFNSSDTSSNWSYTSNIFYPPLTAYTG
jgi:hypothetical protein